MGLVMATVTPAGTAGDFHISYGELQHVRGVLLHALAAMVFAGDKLDPFHFPLVPPIGSEEPLAGADIVDYWEAAFEIHDGVFLSSAHERLAALARIQAMIQEAEVRIPWYPEIDAARFRGPALMAAQAFIDRPDHSGVHSCGETQDIAWVMALIVNHYKRRTDSMSRIIVAALEAISAFFAQAAMSGGYIIKR